MLTRERISLLAPLSVYAAETGRNANLTDGPHHQAMTISIRTLLNSLLAVALVHASPAAAADETARDNHMTSMDAFFACAFGEMRKARAESLSTEAYVAILDQACGVTERELRQRSTSMALKQGRDVEQARATAADAVDQARKELVAIYDRR